MEKSVHFTLKVKQSLLDYARGTASIHSVSTSEVIQNAIKLCMKNHDTFVEFIKREQIKDNENND